MIVSGMLTTDSWMPKRCSNDTLKGSRYIRMKGRERELIIAIRDMRKLHAEELADIRERLYFMKRKNRAAYHLDVCIGQP